jgi:hypothetical protein
MVPRHGVLVQFTDQGERLAEESLHTVIAADEAFLEPLTPVSATQSPRP